MLHRSALLAYKMQLRPSAWPSTCMGSSSWQVRVPRVVDSCVGALSCSCKEGEQMPALPVNTAARVSDPSPILSSQGFSAFGMAASTRVGNALGAGNPEGARLAALASALTAPCLWVLVAAILIVPASQNLLLSLFTRGTDELLLERMVSATDPLLLLSRHRQEEWRILLRGTPEAACGQAPSTPFPPCSAPCCT